jgi:hypothetical protein
LFQFKVPLGVILKNENILDEMIEILEVLNKYVPVMEEEAIDLNTSKKFISHTLHSLLFGGDQLTRKRIEFAIQLRQNSSSSLCIQKDFSQHVRIGMQKNV